MFGKSNKADINSIVGSTTSVRGDVHFSGGLHVDGVVKGNVVAESEGSVLTISDNGRVEGDVRVHNIVLNGEVVGDVYSTQHIELAPNAKVKGNVYYKVIEMSMGAAVNGSLVHMFEESEQQPLSQVKKSA
jgi:cytoskeletal protein CcmA (bactofilin family)